MIKDRLKCIPTILNHDEVPIGRTLISVLKKFNSKPFLTQPCHFFHKTDVYYEIDLDVHTFCWSARQGKYNFKDFLPSLNIDIGFVIEGWGDLEQPEQMLAACRISKVNPKRFKDLLYNRIQQTINQHKNNKDKDNPINSSSNNTIHTG